MEEQNQRKEILKVIHCFKAPIHQAFAYVYYQTYTQDTDTYNYALNSGKENLFSPSELEYLKIERRPEHLRPSLLLKVLQTCCSPSLAQHDHAIWLSNDVPTRCTTSDRVEHILLSFMILYKEFLHNTHKFSIKEIHDFTDTLAHNVSILLQKAAEFSNSKRWTEEKDRLQKMIVTIRRGDLSYTSSIADIVRVEAEFRSDLYVELLSKELKRADESSWDLEVFSFDDKGQVVNIDYEAKEHIEAASIFDYISSKKKSVCWIAGEHGVGKSSLAAFLATSWSARDERIKNIQKFCAVLVISLTELQKVDIDETDILGLLVPLSSLLVGKERLQEWLQKENILIIFDDVNKHSRKIIERVYKAMESLPNLSVWFMGRLSSVLNYARSSSLLSDVVLLELRGLKDERILSLSAEMDADKEKTLKAKLKVNMNRLGPVLKYPSIAHWTFQLYEGSPGAFRNIYSASDLMWEILAWKVRQILKINIKKIGKIRKKFFDWLMLAGELALYSLKADLRLDKESLEELESQITTLFPENGKKWMQSIFKPVITHSFTTCITVIASSNKPFLEYLSSWFFVDQLLNNVQMTQLTNGLVNQLPLILLTAGHLERFQEEGTITIPEERKVIKALVTYREDSYDDFSFIQKFVSELRCIKRLVQIVIDETEYNEEWNIKLSEVQQKSLEVLLNHVSPTRLIFLADESKQNYELSSVMSYVCRVKVSVWLDSLPQFTYGNAQKMDKLLKPFLDERVATTVDLISGLLSSSMMKELSKWPATRHLVLLRLKVSSQKELNSALALHKNLPKLLWLEVKLDMNLQGIDVSTLRPTKVALFDVHMRGVDNMDVTLVAEILSTMHLRFTGIHLEDTDFTPEGVYALLKELSKRGVSMRATPESIDKFRRWYYPALNALPIGKRLSDEEVIDLIGHDDNDFFSDHRVTSSRFVKTIDAWNLRNYLESEKKINHFTYETSNIIFTKTLKGDVEIGFKGDYKENIVEKVMDCKEDSSNPLMAHQVLDLY